MGLMVRFNVLFILYVTLWITVKAFSKSIKHRGTNTEVAPAVSDRSVENKLTAVILSCLLRLIRLYGYNNS